MGTSHELGQNFARAFDITLPRRGLATKSFAWTTSWGTSRRLMGALIMVTATTPACACPPPAAPVQVVALAVRTESRCWRGGC